ncbi:MAG: hypothetical protein A2977_03600 [Alphaproteobacteria bacterium RIFCSPLOWO2_01_FULL_45_8]|nr:MAG: hypothetical protein A2065_01500 [Alphaproteobacteria bacterium GWB1_45_5]OFW76619.1 MAG: hypothetical protein A3K20_00350 [Alphaproteobacteria bacterium GWA1_45_9]OFW89703.1 MAG: hypothetical protein A2621_02240 [Alphaproteobacteria bacterium RIFCSPHIGHO2_01_FULL_41_14]OFW96115.1 MAG: hypothetical protein A2977_03600 [Alphaproteobacteria bacterium RIFCSPLOWO2_01_FULL_45_8]HCI49148.1 hypothetical protein [Holosporales bacterium]
MNESMKEMKMMKTLSRIMFLLGLFVVPSSALAVTAEEWYPSLVSSQGNGQGFRALVETCEEEYEQETLYTSRRHPDFLTFHMQVVTPQSWLSLNSSIQTVLPPPLFYLPGQGRAAAGNVPPPPLLYIPQTFPAQAEGWQEYPPSPLPISPTGVDFFDEASVSEEEESLFARERRMGKVNERRRVGVQRKVEGQPTSDSEYLKKLGLGAFLETIRVQTHEESQQRTTMIFQMARNSKAEFYRRKRDLQKRIDRQMHSRVRLAARLCSQLEDEHIDLDQTLLIQTLNGLNKEKIFNDYLAQQWIPEYQELSPSKKVTAARRATDPLINLYREQYKRLIRERSE